MSNDWSEQSSQCRIGDSELEDLLRAEPRARKEQMLEAAEDVLRCVRAYSRRSTSVLADVLGKHTHFEEWAHYPEHDAVDTHSGYRFYYHAHAARERVRGEHGHFHVFGPAPISRRRNHATAKPDADYTHIVGISVDERGFPMRLFTTNRWVTAEQWLPAASVIRSMHKLDLRRARPVRAARWVQGVVHLFGVQIAAIVRHRDHRMASKAGHADLERLFEDRRSHILSQCRVDLAKQFQFLEGAGVG
ncbi:hypothetical protein [Thiomonas sp. FB-Cd]|uniref:DUF6969 family protein n=1 Tax=Thiomonas sp. FB-Cd TaxID=1158292 RepID=UPI000691165A|nr:hypothetical protein [Thiomonas sp. FB-Cd]